MKDLERERDAAVRTRDKAVEEALRAQRSSGQTPRALAQGEMTPRASTGGDSSRRSVTPVQSPRPIHPSVQMIGIGILLRVFKPNEVSMYMYDRNQPLFHLFKTA